MDEMLQATSQAKYICKSHSFPNESTGGLSTNNYG